MADAEDLPTLLPLVDGVLLTGSPRTSRRRASAPRRSSPTSSIRAATA
jgi:hypothetical protein